MKHYEVMYIIRPNLDEEARKTLIEDMNDVLSSKGATDISVDEWGMRDLAYEIKDYKKGYYVVLQLKADTDATQELDRVMRLREDIIRHIVIAREDKDKA